MANIAIWRLGASEVPEKMEFQQDMVLSHMQKVVISYFKAVYSPGWSRYKYARIIMYQVDRTSGSGKDAVIMATWKMTWSVIGLTQFRGVTA